MSNELKVTGGYICTGASFDRNGGVSAVGIAPPTVQINPHLTFPNLTFIGSVWQEAPLVTGEVLLEAPTAETVGKAPFRFGSTGEAGSLFIITFPLPITLTAPGCWKIFIQLQKSESKQLVHSFNVIKKPSNSLNLSSERQNEFQQELQELINRYQQKDPSKTK